MNTSSNRQLHQLTVKASGINAVNFSGQAKKVPREQHADGTGELMIDPAVVFNYKPSEYRHITELHMGKKLIQALHPNIQNFSNLEILWANDNKLEKIKNILPPAKKGEHHDVTDGARGCVRLKRLYLHNNRLSSLTGDIGRLKYLEVLLLSNNLLSNMEVVSGQLGHLRFLKQLDLFGNPLSEEQNYRPYFIEHHGSMILFDNLTVTVQEKEQAKAIFGIHALSGANGGNKRAKVGFGEHVTLNTNPTTNRKAGPISPSVAIIESRVSQIKLREKASKEFEHHKEEVDYQRLVDRRRLFHSVWGGKEPPTSAFGGANGTTRIGTSKLFEDNPGNDVSKLIDLAAQREEVMTMAMADSEQLANIDAQIKRLKLKVVPERFGDNFGSALEAKKATVAAETQAAIDDKLLPVLYSPEEVATLTKLFEVKDGNGAAASVGGGEAVNGGGAGNEVLSERDVISIRKVLSCVGKLSERDFTHHVESFAVDGPKKTTSWGSTGDGGGEQPRRSSSALPPIQGVRSGGVNLRRGMVIVAQFIPFVQARLEELRHQSETIMVKKSSASGGNPSSGTGGGINNPATMLQRLNLLHDHVEGLKAKRARPTGLRDSEVEEGQARLGSGFTGVLAQHEARDKKGPRKKI